MKAYRLLIGIMAGLVAQSSSAAIQKPAAENVTRVEAIKGNYGESPDGRYLASIERGKVQIYDRKLAQSVRVLPELEESPTRVRYTPDGKHLICDDGRGVFTFWSTRTWKPAFRLDVHKTDKMYGVAYDISPDSRYLAAGRLSKGSSYGSIRYDIDFFDLATRRFVRRLKVMEGEDTYPGHSPSMEFAFHPLGRYLAAAVEYDQGHPRLKHEYVQVFDFYANRWAWWVKGAPPISYSKNGEYFAFQSPSRHLERNEHVWDIKLWNTRVNKLKTIRTQMEGGTGLMSLSRDGNYLLAWAADRQGAQTSLRLFSARSGSSLQTLKPYTGLTQEHRFSAASNEIFCFTDSQETPLEIRRVD